MINVDDIKRKGQGTIRPVRAYERNVHKSLAQETHWSQSADGRNAPAFAFPKLNIFIIYKKSFVYLHYEVDAENKTFAYR